MPLVTFRLSTHSDYKEEVVELWCEKKLIACIYGRLRSGTDAPNTIGIRIISKHLYNDLDHLVIDLDEPPALMIKFD